MLPFADCRADPRVAAFTGLQQFRESSSASGTTAYSVGSSTNIKWHEGSVSREHREKSLNQKGCVL
eukprot:2150248-Pyramimonas_sp.AAC.1